MGNIHSDSGVGESLINHEDKYKEEEPSSVIVENADGWNSIKYKQQVTSVSLLIDRIVFFTISNRALSSYGFYYCCALKEKFLIMVLVIFSNKVLK